MAGIRYGTVNMTVGAWQCILKKCLGFKGLMMILASYDQYRLRILPKKCQNLQCAIKESLNPPDWGFLVCYSRL